MTLQNLEQIRARHALDFAQQVAAGKAIASGKEGGDAIRKIPAMIMASGLLAAIAFAIEERKKKNGAPGEMEPRSKGHRAIFDAIAQHLASVEIDIAPGVADARELIDHLSEQESQTLKLATDEALAWLAYARRFVTGAEAEAAELPEEEL